MPLSAISVCDAFIRAHQKAPEFLKNLSRRIQDNLFKVFNQTSAIRRSLHIALLSCPLSLLQCICHPQQYRSSKLTTTPLTAIMKEIMYTWLKTCVRTKTMIVYIQLFKNYIPPENRHQVINAYQALSETFSQYLGMVSLINSIQYASLKINEWC